MVGGVLCSVVGKEGVGCDAALGLVDCGVVVFLLGP